jgi:hypothetical protein
MDASGHVVMTLVTQHTHNLRRQSVIHNLQHSFAVCLVAFRDRTFFDVSARTVSDFRDVQK